MSATTTLRMILLGEDKTASKTLKGVGSEADKSASKMDKFHKVGAAAGVALAGGLALAGKAAVDMTKKAAEDQLSSEKMAQTFRKAADASDYSIGKTEDWITAQGKLTGVTDDELRPALSKLVVATHSVTKAQHLAHLAMDISAGTGKSLESVSMALAKAQAGNTSGLGRLGVATKDAAGQTLSLHQITKNLTNTYSGAAAKAAETTAGKQKILTTQMSELQEQIGYKLLPVMQKLVEIGLKVVNWISNNTRTAGILIGVLGGLLAVLAAASAATKVYNTLAGIFAIRTAAQTEGTLAYAVAQKASAVASKVAAAAQWLLNAAMDANPIGIVVVALAALATGLVIAYKKSATFRAIVNGAFGAVKHVAGSVLNWLTGAVSWTIGFVKKHWMLLVAIIGGPLALAVALVIKNWSKIKDSISSALGAIKGVMRSGWNAVKGIISGAWDGIRNLVHAQISILLMAIRAIPGAITKVGGAFMNAGKALINDLFRGILVTARSAGGFVSSLVSSIKSAINSSLHLPLQVNFDKGPLHIHATVIPALARGGIVSSPTTALIGEAGPEAVVPLSGPNSPFRNGGLGGDVHITINGALDPVAVGTQVEQALSKVKRLRGGRALAFQ